MNDDVALMCDPIRREGDAIVYDFDRLVRVETRVRDGVIVETVEGFDRYFKTADDYFDRLTLLCSADGFDKLEELK